MRFGYFKGPAGVFAGLLEGRVVYPLPDGFGGKPAQQGYRAEDLKVLAPCRPSKIVCGGLNYRDHALELGYPFPEEPVLFLKPPTTVIGPEDVILTGTPSGVGPLRPGDSVTVEIEGLGRLRNRVVPEEI